MRRAEPFGGEWVPRYQFHSGMVIAIHASCRRCWGTQRAIDDPARRSRSLDDGGNLDTNIRQSHHGDTRRARQWTPEEETIAAGKREAVAPRSIEEADTQQQPV